MTEVIYPHPAGRRRAGHVPARARLHRTRPVQPAPRTRRHPLPLPRVLRPPGRTRPRRADHAVRTRHLEVPLPRAPEQRRQLEGHRLPGLRVRAAPVTGPLRESLVGTAVLSLPAEIRESAVREFQTWLDGLRDIPADVARQAMADEALLRTEANDPAAPLYEAAAATSEANRQTAALEAQLTEPPIEGDRP